MDPHRAQRVSESIREELDELIGYEMSDPRVEGVRVSEVVVSPDLRHAHVFLTIPDAKETALVALAGAKAFLRRQLAERLQLFHVPELTFEANLTTEAGPRLRQILRRVKKGRPRDEKNPS